MKPIKDAWKEPKTSRHRNTTKIRKKEGGEKEGRTKGR